MGLALAAQAALGDWLSALDAEAWVEVAEGLDDEVQLADELTTGWLRGRERVGAYLRASEGIVTDIVSTPSAMAVTEIGTDIALITFSLHQRYQFDGERRSEHSTACACFRDAGEGPKLALLQIAPVGAASHPDDATDGRRGAPPALPQPTEEPVGEKAVDEEPDLVLGSEVRRRRSLAGLSLRELAARTGLSPSFLSQLERSLADPSVSSLRRLAHGLDVDVQALLGREDAASAGGFREGRRADRPRVFLAEAGVAVEAFGGLAAGGLEAYVAHAPHGHVGRDATTPAGTEEFMYVLDGSVELRVGQRSLVLGRDDGVHIAGGVPRRVSALGPDAARYLVVQHRPAP